MVEDNKMIVKQEYDTETAGMVFGEEDIDWKVMNIKMTIDKTGSQHPSWIYTPLYTKDILTPNLKSPKEDQFVIQPHPVDAAVDESSTEFETISVSETFDVEEAQWKENEAFRLTFDPTGKRNPQIQLVVIRKVPAGQLLEEIDVTDNIPVPKPEVPAVYVTQDTQESITTSECDDESTTEVEEPVPQATLVAKKTIKKHIGGSVRVKNQTLFDPLDESTSSTFILPDISKYAKDLGAFMKDELIDIHMMSTLTASNGINWWADIPGCTRLHPLWQQQDGKSFLRSLNFVLYGFQDKRSAIQSGLHRMLQNPLISTTVKQRWMYEICVDQSNMGNSVYSADHLEKRWISIIQGGWCAYIQYIQENPGVDSPPPEGCRVEPIHVYMLANVLRRPIVVLTGLNNMELSNEEELSGIYLPFEQDPEESHKYPIVVGYTHLTTHFCPLVTATAAAAGRSVMANDRTQTTVPITDSFLSLLPVHFAVLPDDEWQPDESGMNEEITELSNEQTLHELAKYLHVTRVQYRRDNDANDKITIAAKINTNQKPEAYDDLLKNYAKGAKGRFKAVKKMKCKTPKCKKIPSSQLNGVCYKCYQQTLDATNNIE